MTAARTDAPSVLDFLNHQHAKALHERGMVLRASTARTLARHVSMAETRCDGALTDTLVDRDATTLMLTRMRSELVPGTMRNVLSTVTRYGAWLVETGTIPCCVLVLDDLPRVSAHRRLVIYSPEDVELLLAAAELASPRAHLFIATLVGTGLRVGEALALRWQDVKRDPRPVPRVAVTDSKTHKPRTVPMTPGLAAVWSEVDEAVLRSGVAERSRDGISRARTFRRSIVEHPFPWSYSTTQRLTQGLCADAGIEYQGIHAIRHYYATHLLEHGADILAVSRLLGHSSVGITAETYSHTTPMSYTSVLGW